MRSLLRSFLLAVLAIPGTRAVAQQKIDVHRAVTSDVSVRISGALGTINIIGWNRDSVAITGTVSKGSRFEGGFGGDGTRPAQGLKFFIEGMENAPATGNVLELRVPARARVWAKSGTGRIVVTGVTGGLDLNIVGGSVEVQGTPRELTIESMDGSITIDGSPEWMRAKTATGDITVRGGSRDASVSTVSGTIRVNDGAFERARFEAVTGNIVFAADAAPAGALGFDTHSGAIEIRLGPKPNVDIDALSITGTIENALTGRPAVTSRDGRGQEIGLQVGMGAARLTIRTFKGNIRLAYR
jgi:hypothetical protein